MDENDVSALIRDTLTYLKDPLLPKQGIFAEREEWAFFQKKSNVKKLPVQSLESAPPFAPPILPIKEKVNPLPVKSISTTEKTVQSKPEKVEITAIPNVILNLVSDKASATDLQAKPARSQVMFENMADARGCKDGDAGAVKNQILNHVRYEETPASPAEPLSPIKKTLQRIAPHFKLIDQVPDDMEAKRTASAWKEKIPDAEVVLLACDTQADTLELLKGLAKAIDQHLAKSKVIAADRLEREKRWDLFLEKNPLRLIIASSAMQQFPELMRYYRAVPANAQFFLDKTPLLVLSPASVYKSLEHKALLWKTLCQMLKK